MLLRTMCVGLGLALLTGCATAGPGTEGTCTAFRPIYVSRADQLTEETAQQLLTHNETGVRVCGWRPGRSP